MCICGKKERKKGRKKERRKGRLAKCGVVDEFKPPASAYLIGENDVLNIFLIKSILRPVSVVHSSESIRVSQ